MQWLVIFIPCKERESPGSVSIAMLVRRAMKNAVLLPVTHLQSHQDQYSIIEDIALNHPKMPDLFQCSESSESIFFCDWR